MGGSGNFVAHVNALAAAWELPKSDDLTDSLAAAAREAKDLAAKEAREADRLRAVAVTEATITSVSEEWKLQRSTPATQRRAARTRPTPVAMPPTIQEAAAAPTAAAAVAAAATIEVRTRWPVRWSCTTHAGYGGQELARVTAEVDALRTRSEVLQRKVRQPPATTMSGLSARAGGHSQPAVDQGAV
jgi:hypothetical protein